MSMRPDVLRWKFWLWMVPIWVALSGPSRAQVAEIGLFAGGYQLGNKNIGGLPIDRFGNTVDVGLDSGWLFGFGLTVNNYRFFGHEFGYAYNRTTMKFAEGAAGEAGTAVHRGFYNFLIYAMPEGAPVRLFVTGGGHFHNYAWPGLSAVSGGGSTKFGLNYGGGIKFRVSHMFGIRFDYREYRNGKPFDLLNQEGWIRHRQFTAGLSLLL